MSNRQSCFLYFGLYFCYIYRGQIPETVWWRQWEGGIESLGKERHHSWRWGLNWTESLGVGWDDIIWGRAWARTESKPMGCSNIQGISQSRGGKGAQAGEDRLWAENLGLVMSRKPGEESVSKKKWSKCPVLLRDQLRWSQNWLLNLLCNLFLKLQMSNTYMIEMTGPSIIQINSKDVNFLFTISPKMAKWQSVHAVTSVLSDSLQPHGYSLPGFFVRGILQARILELVVMPFSRVSSWPRNQTHVFYICLYWQMGSLPLAPPGKLLK